MTYAMQNNWIMSLFAITLNFSTGEIGWSSSSTTASGPGAGVDNLLLTSGLTDNLLLTSGSTDVLLLT